MITPDNSLANLYQRLRVADLRAYTADRFRLPRERQSNR